MGARQDLQAVAAKLAATARDAAVDGKPITYESLRIAGLAEGAKDALAAAALVDAEQAPIVEALRRLAEQLGAPIIELTLEDEGEAAALDLITDTLRSLERRAAVGDAYEKGYTRLRGLCSILERDFSAGAGETAQRIAGRIHSGLEEAEQAITIAKRSEEATGG